MTAQFSHIRTMYVLRTRAPVRTEPQVGLSVIFQPREQGHTRPYPWACRTCPPTPASFPGVAAARAPRPDPPLPVVVAPGPPRPRTPRCRGAEPSGAERNGSGAAGRRRCGTGRRRPSLRRGPQRRCRGARRQRGGRGLRRRRQGRPARPLSPRRRRRTTGRSALRRRGRSAEAGAREEAEAGAGEGAGAGAAAPLPASPALPGDRPAGGPAAIGSAGCEPKVLGEAICSAGDFARRAWAGGTGGSPLRVFVPPPPIFFFFPLLFTGSWPRQRGRDVPGCGPAAAMPPAAALARGGV